MMAQFGKWVMLAVLCFIGETVLGAPTKGRYVWLRCRPDVKNANCVQEKGPMINLDKYPDAPKRLPQSAVQEVLPKDTGLEPEEQSGDNAGAGKHIPAFADRGSGDQLVMDSPMQDVPEGSGMEEGSADFDYTNIVYPEKVPYWEEYENNFIQ
ncbi:serglycin [Clupea harengus]|uniref:Serglycin n=1 Tax=Clupea harengus TaxID=7950 RepID=A0A6P3VI22_CLUHA|nr:serglycin [Clupea harengus]